MHLLDGEEEVRLAEKKLNIELLNIAEADFLSRFDHVAGVAKACDLVITMATTASNIAGSVGANVIEIRPSYTSVCMDVLPWYPNHQRVFREWDQSYGGLMDSVSQLAKEAII